MYWFVSFHIYQIGSCELEIELESELKIKVSWELKVELLRRMVLYQYKLV
jgi:hypothetical protein